MSLLEIGIVLLIAGAILWATIAPALGYVFLVLGLILVVVGLVMRSRASRL